VANVAVLDVMADVAQLVRQAPNGTLIGAYIRAARRFCRESRWYRATLPGQTAAGTKLYSLGSDPYLEVLGLKAASANRLTGDTKVWPLGVSDTTSWDPNAQPGKPKVYAYVPEAQFALFPTPDNIYALTLTLVLQPKAGANQVPEELLVKWDQTLQAGALSYLYSLADMPWTSAAEAARNEAIFKAGISNAKADEQREYNAGTQFIKRRPFLVGRM
jgi:hypothetical protein